MNQERFAFRGSAAAAELRPSFLCIGQPHSATTWLSGVLSLHPQVSIPQKLRAVDYFSFNYHLGERWYLDQFPEAGRATRIMGDVEPLCVYCDLSAPRVANFGSIGKLIIMLRDPSSWIVSAYHSVNKASSYSRDRAQFLKFHSRVFELLRTYDYIRNYFEFFDREQFLFVTRQELVADMEAVKNRLSEFLEIDRFRNDASRVLYNAARQPRFRLLYKQARRLRDRHFPKFEWTNAVESRAPFLRNALFREPPPPPGWLLEELRARRDIVNAQTERLGEAIGRDLSGWRID